jgi:hypothetical protein
MKSILSFAVCVFAVAAVVRSEGDDDIPMEDDVEDYKRAHVLVLEERSPGAIVVGQEFNVTYTVFNVGEVDALDVEITDEDTWAESYFEQTHNEPGMNIKKLAPGAKEAHYFTVKASKATPPLSVFNPQPANVEYSWMETGEDGEDEIVSTDSKSTTLDAFGILTKKQYAKETASSVGEWGVFSVVFSSGILAPFYVWQQANNAGAKRKV